MFSHSFIISCVFKSFLICVGTEDVKSIETDITDICELPIYSGPCNTTGYPLYLYSYNKTSGQCEEVNADCQDNSNKFPEEHCEVTCEDVCNRPIVKGSCKGQITRYGYNKTSDQCEKFFYSGCGGNGNNFETEYSCEAECQNVCNRRVVTGSCRAFISSYGYNRETGQCEFFVYGGCEGTANRFRTEEECEEKCEDNACKMPIKPGPCEAYNEVYGYNKTSGKCEQFIYGGCKGNTNNFATILKCQNQCEDVCNKPIEAGDCDAIFQRYGYNKVSGQCEEFTYGGCGGNGNNFEIKEVCEDECEAGCYKPIDYGRCLGRFERYAYNKASKQCEMFIYGGCEGTRNNYETKEECEAECSKCNQQIIAGPCNGTFPVYGYNSETNQCEMFNYGGCQGNDNRFDTEEECETSCETSY